MGCRSCDRLGQVQFKISLHGELIFKWLGNCRPYLFQNESHWLKFNQFNIGCGRVSNDHSHCSYCSALSSMILIQHQATCSHSTEYKIMILIFLPSHTSRPKLNGGISPMTFFGYIFLKEKKLFWFQIYWHLCNDQSALDQAWEQALSHSGSILLMNISVTRAPFTWINNYILYRVRNEITHTFPIGNDNLYRVQNENTHIHILYRVWNDITHTFPIGKDILYRVRNEITHIFPIGNDILYRVRNEITHTFFKFNMQLFNLWKG